MTLASVPAYDPDRLAESRNSAIVVGASIAGLLAARVLADRFERVTVIERDPLPETPMARRSVPQGRHIHVLLEAGRATLEDLFPGFCAELLSAGAVPADFVADNIVHDSGGLLADGQEPMLTLFATRPLIEQLVRERLMALDGVTILAGHPVVDYRQNDDRSAVTGVEVRDDEANTRDYDAELVVDATGRSSATPTWLDRNGYPTPPVDEVEIDLAYSTVVLQRPIEDNRAFFIAPDPPRARGVGVFPAEHGQWVVSAFGMHGDHPPTDPRGFRDFVAELPGIDIVALLENQSWVSAEIAHYPLPSNRRIRYEALNRFPEGLVVTGDALASFNPIYGQGMSVAALEALQLGHTLAEGGVDAIGPRFFDRVKHTVDVPWKMAVGGDFAFDETTGPKPWGTGLHNWYFERVTRRAHSDGTVRDDLTRVLTMERDPASLFRPSVLWRVFRPDLFTTGGNGRPSREGRVGPLSGDSESTSA